MKLIMEGWRDFLGKASDSSENKDKEKPPPPSSAVSALMKRAGLSRDEAEKQAKRQVDLEESEELEEVWSGIKKVVGKIRAKAKADIEDEDEAAPAPKAKDPDAARFQAASSRNIADARAKRPRGGSRGSFE